MSWITEKWAVKGAEQAGLSPGVDKDGRPGSVSTDDRAVRRRTAPRDTGW